jgi:diacylglycerol kinase family enzyme
VENIGAMPERSPEPTPDDPGLAALINPLSFRMSLRDRARRSAERVERRGGEVFEVSGLEEIEAALEEATRRAVSRLVIAGGDGTLQGTVSWLARHLDRDRLPELIVLSAGRTNYVAGDIGSRHHFPDTLEAILRADPASLHPVERSTLELYHPRLGQQHGFFMAAATLDEIIRYVHRWQAAKDNWWRRRHAASTLGVLSLGGRLMTGRHRFDFPPLAVECDSLGRLDGACRFLLLTTLTHEGSLVDPYAARGSGALRITAVRRGARGFPIRFPRLVRGAFSESMSRKNGYLSGRCSNIRVHNLARITLDGQEFDLDPDTPLEVRAGPTFRFLRP